MKKKLLGLFSIVLTLFLLVGCFEKSYKVQFDLNNGTSAAIAEQTIKSGGLVRKPIDPTRENYNFIRRRLYYSVCKILHRLFIR